VGILDAFTEHYCYDCIITGKQESHTSKGIHKFIQFHREFIYADNRCTKTMLHTDESKIWLSLLVPSTEQEIEINNRFGDQYELSELDQKYRRKAKRMKNARFSYEGIPVKMSINFNEGSPCYYCHKTIGKACKCKDTYYRLLK
jgi:hypothetical protein